MDRTQSFLKYREQSAGQGLQRRSLHRLEEFAYLLAGGAMDARVGYVLLPVGEKKILRGQTLKAPSFDRVVLRVLHARLHLALVPGHDWLGRQNHRAVVPGKLLQLVIDLGIEPVSLDHARLQVVYNHRGRDSTEMSERIFQAANETLTALPPDRLAVSLARMTQHTPEQMRPAPLPVLEAPCSLSEIHLQLLAGCTLHPTKGRLSL